ncbi:MAG: mannose-1-phosphate guanylyltransferase [Bacteroidetes bacterium]|nr:mannose-1-phosphate guanylyltransferase [Bacteroidota bacterium]
MKNLYCVIMAGGVGSRFWPMSKTSKPKQFLDVLGTGETLLQNTVSRFLKVCKPDRIYIVTSEQYQDLVAQQLPKIPKENILLEPARKNTAPCVAYAAYKIHQKNPKAVTVVAPSDHLITKEDVFLKAVKSCYNKASAADCLLTIGIKPTRPDTGYGYIQFVNSDQKEKDARIKKVKTFTEKPDAAMAQFFMESGDFLWNAGIFIWSTQSIIQAIEKHEPELSALFKDTNGTIYGTNKEAEFIKNAYVSCKNISIDYAVMEKAPNVYVRASIIGWSDLGTWGSLYEHIKHDKNHNAVVGKNVMLYDTKNCIVHVPKEKLVLIQGLEDHIVVESDGVLLICKKTDEQQIRNFVNDVKIQKGEKFV